MPHFSYAVTNSGRGGGDIDRETLSIEAAKAASLMALISTEYTRYKLSDGPPRLTAGGFTTLCTTPTGSNSCLWYFRPQLPTSINLMGTVYNVLAINNGRRVNGLGTTDDEALVFLEDLPPALCEEINRQLGFDTVPENSSLSFPSSIINLPSYQGEVTMCFTNPDSGGSDPDNVYYYAVNVK